MIWLNWPHHQLISCTTYVNAFNVLRLTTYYKSNFTRTSSHTAFQQLLAVQNNTFRTLWRRIIPVTESWTVIVVTKLSLAGRLEASNDGSSPGRVLVSLFMQSDAGTDSDNVTDDVAELTTVPLLRPLFVNACWRRSTSTDTYQTYRQ